MQDRKGVSHFEQSERDDLDGKLPHAEAWESLADIYENRECEDIDIVSDPNRELVKYAVDKLIPIEYDELNQGDFKVVTEYTMARYKEAMKNTVVSDQ